MPGTGADASALIVAVEEELLQMVQLLLLSFSLLKQIHLMVQFHTLQMENGVDLLSWEVLR
ncbi:MAG: hypothetical protein R2809_05465 [Flavobacteriales bacterium]